MPTRLDDLDPLPYTADMPSLLSAWGRVDIHTVAAKFLADNKITGAYLEFGVGIGRSAVSAIRAYRRAKVSERFVLFDSFQGLPALTGVDVDSIQFKEGAYAATQEAVTEFLARHQIEIDDAIELCAGWLSDTLPAWAAANAGTVAAILHIDVDLHASCRDVLAHVGPFLQPGTVVLFDDWNCFKASARHGERRAAAEWLDANPGYQLHPYTGYGWSGQAFILDM